MRLRYSLLWLVVFLALVHAVGAGLWLIDDGRYVSGALLTAFAGTIALLMWVFRKEDP